MITKFFKNIKHEFGPCEVLEIENPAINGLTSTKFLSEMIQKVLETEKKNIINLSYSSHQIVIVTTDSGVYNIVKSLTSSSFSQVVKKTINNNGFSYYHIFINISSIPKLIQFLNKKIIYPIYKLTNSFPKFSNNSIIIKIPNYMDIEKIKKNIINSNIVNIRKYSESKNSIKMPTFNGESTSVSEPVFFGTWSDPIIQKIEIHENTTVIAHFSPETIEKINDLRSTNPGLTICIEVGGTIYSIFTLQKNKSINSGIQLAKCKTKAEAKEIVEKIQTGYFNNILIKKQYLDTTSKLYILFILAALYLLLMGLFLCLKKKKVLNLALFLSAIMFSYFSYINYGLTIGLMLNLIFQILIFTLIFFINKIFNHFGNYLLFSLFLINLCLLGIGIVNTNAYLEIIASQFSVNSGISFITLSILQVIKTKDN